MLVPQSVDFAQAGELLHALLRLPAAEPDDAQADAALPGGRRVGHDDDAAADALRDQAHEQPVRHQARTQGFRQLRTQKVEIEVLVADDGTGGVVHDRVVVDAQVVGIGAAVPGRTVRLDVGAGVLVAQTVLLGRAGSREPAGDAGAVPLPRVEAAQLEPLGGVFRFGDLHLAVRPFRDFYFHRCHHRLAVEAAQAGLAVVEDVPLPADLAEAAVRVAARGGGHDGVAFSIPDAGAGVNEGASVGPGAEGMVAPGPGQVAVGGRQAEFAFGGYAAVDEDVFVLDFSDRGGLEEAEHAVLLAAGHHVLDGLGAFLHRTHRLRVQLRAPGLLEAPVAIDAAVVVDEGRGVEAHRPHGAGGVFGIPVAYGEGAVGPVRAGDHAAAAVRLGVGIQVVGLLAVRAHLLRDVGRIEDVRPAVGVERPPERVEAGFEDHPVETPVAQVIDRRRPDHLVAAAIGADLDVVRAVDIDAELPGPVGVLEHVGFPVGNVFPEREVGVGGGGAGAQQAGAGDEGGEMEKAFHRQYAFYKNSEFRPNIVILAL